MYPFLGLAATTQLLSVPLAIPNLNGFQLGQALLQHQSNRLCPKLLVNSVLSISFNAPIVS